MFRIILYFLIFYFAYKLFKSFKFSNKDKVNPKSGEKEKMVKCENCGIYSPESSNLNKNGKYFCSKKCVEGYFKNEKT